jgi:hypothetical protein
MMPMNFADAIADAMSEIRRRTPHPWQVPGCRRMLLDYAHEAPTVPLAEIGVAALLFAQSRAKAPALELFRSGPHWRDLPEHARIVRPSELPRCEVHRLFLPCTSCAADAKADAQPVPVVTPTRTYDQHDVNARGIASVRAALTAPRRVEDEG